MLLNFFLRSSEESLQVPFFMDSLPTDDHTITFHLYAAMGTVTCGIFIHLVDVDLSCAMMEEGRIFFFSNLEAMFGWIPVTAKGGSSWSVVLTTSM
ncbi:hypothetical protein DVH24_025036 [Malus domestica]|uniref:Uncharacterized protein n=1 Tax=Malus domestica TaxID=3750 RepID=A0A498JP35_MALDO|nr:hypothetical protein DVH24_025036 [Malus domestica]